MLERIEVEDEDAISRAGILRTLASVWAKGASFTTADVAERLRKIADALRTGGEEAPDMAELRRFCTAARAASPTSKSINRALKSIEAAPTAVDDSLMTMKAVVNSKTHVVSFAITVTART